MNISSSLDKTKKKNKKLIAIMIPIFFFQKVKTSFKYKIIKSTKMKESEKIEITVEQLGGEIGCTNIRISIFNSQKVQQITIRCLSISIQ